MIPVTSLSTYLYCPRNLYLRYVLKVVPKIKGETVLGKIKHEVFDGINKVEEKIIKNIQVSNIDNIGVLYEQVYQNILQDSFSKYESNLQELKLDKEEELKNAWPAFLEEARLRADNLFRFVKQNKVYGIELWNALTPKIISETSLFSKKLRLKGVIDRVEVHDGHYTPVELKTGNMPREGIWPNHRIQLSSYILLLREKFRSEFGFVEYLDYGVRRKVAMNPFLEQEVAELVSAVHDLLESDKLPLICNNKNKCAKCALRESCF